MERNPGPRSPLRFRTTRTTIHALDSADEEAVAFVRDLLNDPRVYKSYSDEGREPLTVGDIEDDYESDDKWVFVAQATGSDEFVGAVEIDQVERRVGSAVFGLLVKPKYQGRGYGAEILAPIVDWLFETMRMHRVWTLIGENADTESITQIHGFEKEGVMRDADYIDGGYIDRHIVACLEDDWAETKRKLADYLSHFKPEDAEYPRLPTESDDEITNREAPERATLHEE